MKKHEPDLVIPYFFDTRFLGRFVLKVVLGFAPIFAMIGAVVLAAVGVGQTPHEILMVLGVVLAANIALAFVMYRKVGGAHGTLGREQLTIEPDRVLGVVSKSSRGAFELSDFKGFKLGKLSPNSTYSQLRLIGQDPKLQVVLAVGPHGQVAELADYLQSELPLKALEAA